MPYHLPVLLNPLVNAVFNCPNPSTSSLKKLFTKLKDQRFILLVPPSEKLLDCTDKLSGSPLQELCYSFDFVASHILLIDELNGDYITTGSPSQVKFDTLNAKNVIVRSQNRVILTSEGFQFKKRCHITNVDLFMNFNEYLLPGYNFPLLYIDEPVCAESVRLQQSILQQSFQSNQAKSKEEISLTLNSLHGNKSSFENILRIHPDWSGRFNSYFAEYRNTPDTDGPHVQLFHDIVRRAYSAMKSEPVFMEMPDLFDLVYEYVELNLYDDIWVRITYYFRELEVDLEGFKYLSLHQLGIDLYSEKFEEFSLKKVVRVESNIESSMNSFSRLPLAHAHADKATYLMDTLRNLSKADEYPDCGPAGMAIDADTLLSLFVLVVSRTQLRSLKGQLFYLQNFAISESSVKFGVLGYAISTLEAVVCHFDELRGTKRSTQLGVECESAHTFIEMLSSGSTSPDFSQYRNITRYRTGQGESVLSLCITNFRNDILEGLLKNEEDFPLEDLIEDQTTDGCTLVMQALKCGNGPAANLIAGLLISSCTREELCAYLNKADKDGRTAAHYLTHEVDILEQFGSLFNWDVKDSSGHTALFTIFRSYDQSNYDEMVKASFSCAAKWYAQRNKPFCFTDHEDRKGNTLLHILKRSISILLQYDSIDVNARNKKGLTPLMIYAKYNRLDNIKAILTDRRVILGKVQRPLLLGCIDYAKNPSILKEVTKKSAKETALGYCFVHSSRFESSSWLLKITIRRDEDDDFEMVEFHLKTVQNCFRTILKICPMTFLPLDLTLHELTNIGRARLSNIGKLETTSYLRSLTRCFNVLIAGQELPKFTLASESKLLSWIKAQYKILKNGGIRSSNKKVEPEEMSSMQGFLRFNLAELFTLRSKLYVLKKLAIFLRLKSLDVKQSMIILLRIGFENMGELTSTVSEISTCTAAYGEDSMVPLVEDIDFMLKCTNRLYDHINNLLQVKIPEWWKLYGELLNYHKQYAQNFPHLVRNGEPSTEAGIIGKIMEGKKEKLEKRLSFGIAETRRSMNQTGAAIALEHEGLAEQLSQFMDFKATLFYRGMIKKWVRENIKELNERLIHIKKDLQSLSK